MTTPPSTPLVTLRELGPGEYDVLDAVVAGLSPDSRVRRFLGPVPELAPAVRDALAAVDGRRHLAVAAFAGGRPIGIARLVGEEPGRAELAVEVVDAWQGRGVGSRLARAVLDRGREAGFTTVVADVLAENPAARGLARALFPGLSGRPEGTEIAFTADLTAHEPSRAVANAA
ncbi:GNAT family N-acetyltransferase [Actinomycetospora sp. TBRC 11914]|uniref:GNAT family N-acetyltransferase n=1 Tax=Actinomycetospora sp. TBRC 11914 TaxID=2729387 RepID=UPI00145FBB1E|nr:GNAT family N-acetyltransferase [Actinomycetospora sp. TBRC 11914]NMO88952.1 GNAT family N-acetyltransferase [Actinomycetospora sp. TBRC 11914]